MITDYLPQNKFWGYNICKAYGLFKFCAVVDVFTNPGCLGQVENLLRKKNLFDTGKNATTKSLLF